MRQIIFWELNQRKSYIIWWLVVTACLVTLLLLVYPSIHSQANQLNKVLNQLPATLRDLKTGGSQVDITTPTGYLNSQLYYLTLPLLQIIMSIGLGSSLLARDEQNHTLELLMARPLSRGNILAAKALSGIIIMFLVCIVTFVITIVMAKLVSLDVSALHLFLATLYSTLFSLSFGVIAFTLCAISSLTRRTSIGLAAVVGFSGYLLASLENLSHYLITPAKFLPYHYYSPSQILMGHIPLGLNLYIVATLLIGSLLSWRGFNQRDIT
jgi:ABC-2 type transport system permease protein